MTTINPTLPQNWADNIVYNKEDKVFYLSVIYSSLVDNNINKNPVFEQDYWQAIDIYKKNETIMPHGDYSGDANFWERDNIYIDGSGWVYVNNENTGINVKGRDGDVTISFEDLSPEQKAQIQGERGVAGPVGPQGPQGERGPIGEVVLTPEQIEELKGDQGESAYDIWIEQGHSGTEEDFLKWLQEQAITIDDTTSTISNNPVQNKVITAYINDYKTTTDTIINNLLQRITLLENLLTTEYNGEVYQFKFGITGNGKYGYIPKDSIDVVPFDNTDNDLSSMYTIRDNLSIFTDMGQYNTEPLSQTNISDILEIQPTSFTMDFDTNNTGESSNYVTTTSITRQGDANDILLPIYSFYNNGVWDSNDTVILTFNLIETNNSINSIDSGDGTSSKTGLGANSYEAPDRYSKMYIEITSINESSSYNETLLYFYNNIDDSNEYNLDIILTQQPVKTININKGETQLLELDLIYDKAMALITPTATNNFRITKIYYK